MNDIQDKLDQIFIDQLEYEYNPQELAIPEIDGADNIISYRREYTAHNINIIIVECNDRRIEFQKELIKKDKNVFPNSYFLFVSNNGKVFDLYNDTTSKNKRKITYDEISLKTALFKEKIQLFNVSKVDNSTELQINVEKAFDTNDKVAKSFFDKFQTVHKKLQSAITGIDNPKDLSWYASVLMNRFMFIYFLQKHNVLQDNPDFLLDKFNEVKKKDKDYYHDFLLPLFFYGFARKDNNLAKQEFTDKYGDVRYLNGGLFYPHQVEKKYTPSEVTVKPHEERCIHTTIQVDAKKIKEVLVFLNEYTWYLDQRPMENEKHINPDVLGYIFEKYINQKELGAYYTKEDITEYISKNTIIPFILDKMRKQGFSALDPNPLITNNEDIIGAMHHYVESIDSYDEAKFLYSEVLQPLSVLDPSVGSGAFLFAALNILLPIYQKVVHKLRHFSKGENDKWLHEHLALIDKHSEEYFLTKQIILNNLYGVDIVEEATEICKLRLFLQLVSHISDIKLIEPLPDIDFNIYAGNSLVGGTSWDDLVSNYTMDLFVSQNRDQIKDDIEKLSEMKRSFRHLQQQDDNEDKLTDLKNNILTFNSRINKDLRLTIDNPFHWFVDFHSLMKNGGFDVIIGNPPYVTYSDKLYQLSCYETLKCKDLYAFFIERSNKLLNQHNSYIGMIVPISIVGTSGYSSLRKNIFNHQRQNWFSNYAMRPGKLFDKVDKRLTIWLGARNLKQPATYTTKYQRWWSNEREKLFNNLEYIHNSIELTGLDSIPKVSFEQEISILNKLKTHKPIEFHIKRNGSKLYHTRKLMNFVQFLDAPPYSIKENGEKSFSTELKQIYFENNLFKDVALAIYNSNLFFWFYIAFSDCRNVNRREVTMFPFDFDKVDKKILDQLQEKSLELQEELQRNSFLDTRNYKNIGVLKVQTFAPRESKLKMDEIDILLAKVYNLSLKEVEFIINYDAEFRMGELIEEEE